jgi:UDP-N-acetylmuramoyl-L-alanyl-D-glutamate--2,6-diaminopimelate ligase
MMGMKLLQDILYTVRIKSLTGRTDLHISDVQIDSRLVGHGSCFIAIKGASQDGHAYIETAIQNGATAIVCEVLPSSLRPGVNYIQTDDAAKAAGIMAHAFHGEPSRHLKLVGVTGTNGKTTVATLLYKLFMSLDASCGLISTVSNMIGETVSPSTHTTPDVISLNILLKRMVDAGCKYAFMEVSSHAIHQQRIAGLEFAGGIFTNITHDHLDYHKTFDEYIRVKRNFFDGLSSTAFAISNMDDRNGAIMLQNTHADKFYYSLRSVADFKGRIVDNSITGLQMLVNEQDVHFRLIGEFNAYNLLAVYATAICLGEDRLDVLQAMSNLTGAEGRFDYMLSPRESIIGIVDYAHTPDALLNVLATIKKFQKGGEQIITVVGCGGDRDKSKRKLMGAAAAEFSTRAIFTSDNPRSEEPSSILNDMMEGVDAVMQRKVLMIEDRKEAIRTAVMMARGEDIILVAGKGHEKYQEIKGQRFSFDDKDVLVKTFNDLDK